MIGLRGLPDGVHTLPLGDVLVWLVIRQHMIVRAELWTVAGVILHKWRAPTRQGGDA